jgi:hypothetical protein
MLLYQLWVPQVRRVFVFGLTWDTADFREIQIYAVIDLVGGSRPAPGE